MNNEYFKRILSGESNSPVKEERDFRDIDIRDIEISREGCLFLACINFQKIDKLNLPKIYTSGQLYWSFFEAIKVDVRLRVHTPFAVVFGGINRNARKRMIVIVCRRGGGSSYFEILNEEERISTFIRAVPLEPPHDGLVLFGMVVPFLSRRIISVRHIIVGIDGSPIGFKVRF